ncbi:hypothetical protein [Nocardia gipuzkoensis]|uniref:hypothetical protein n=1 Tax=Nocardia gipuzkoensis TaxID=2749991 RepID=UPI00237DBBB2|nr:hypothetical protein [Nocardia gipuzkoensis]MDE1675129.1 hypothetical protein [Nocardia gipuzkoensis]
MKLEPAAFSVHSYDGAMLGVIECPTDYVWTRELNEVSRLTLTAPTQQLATEVTPWLHWVTCWHGQQLQWTGPVQDSSRDHISWNLEVRDVSTFLWRTRTQTTRRWEQLDVAPIAADMWREMLSLHRVDAEPVVMPALAESGRFNFSVSADLRMLQQEMADLSKLGLRWTVHRGRPVIGSQPSAVAAELSDCHLTTGARIRRSGAKTANDVRVQGKNGAWTQREELGGLHLQSIVSLDDLFGVSNIERAAAQYVRKSAAIRDELVIPQSATLAPDAPVELDMLVPGVNLAVSALGLRTVLRVDQVQVAGSSSDTQVSLTLSTPDNITELERAGGRS